MSRRLLLAGLIGLTLSVPAVPAGAAEDIEALAARTPWRTENGRETRSFEFPGGVVIVQERHGENISTTGFDKSPGGAVLCLAQVLIGVQVEEDMCPGRNDEWAREIGTALDRIYSFIAANSLTPTTKDEVLVWSKRKTAEFKDHLRKSYERPGDAASLCRAIGQEGFGGRFRMLGLEALRAHVDKALAVPRPPVLNPCL